MKAWWGKKVKAITTNTFAENKNLRLVNPVKHQSWCISEIASTKRICVNLQRNHSHWWG